MISVQIIAICIYVYTLWILLQATDHETIVQCQRGSAFKVISAYYATLRAQKNTHSYVYLSLHDIYSSRYLRKYEISKSLIHMLHAERQTAHISQ